MYNRSVDVDYTTAVLLLITSSIPEVTPKIHLHPLVLPQVSQTKLRDFCGYRGITYIHTYICWASLANGIMHSTAA